MGKLIILRGVSGSGKSTWARQYKADHDKVIVVNRDKIRELLFGSEDDFGVDESLVSYIEHSIVFNATARSYDVVIDATHVKWEYIRKWKNLALTMDYEIQIHLFDTELDDALENNRNRAKMGGRFVPEHVIRNQWEQLQVSKDWTL